MKNIILKVHEIFIRKNTKCHHLYFEHYQENKFHSKKKQVYQNNRPHHSYSKDKNDYCYDHQYYFNCIRMK